MEIILASASPRRREILMNAGYSCRVIPAKLDEIVSENLPPCEIVKALAQQKASAVLNQNKAGADAIVIGADTIVVLDGRILGKPSDKEDAFEMLSSLSGRTHSVYTGVCIIHRGKTQCFSKRTDVKFYPLSADEIRAYIATGEPGDKAGAYGIQGKGSLLVESICGDYFNVVGLPVSELTRYLKNIE